MVGDRRRPVDGTPAGARARYVVPDEALGEPVRERTVGEVIEAAQAAGAPVERRDGETVVEVVAGITTTLGGIAVDRAGARPTGSGRPARTRAASRPEAGRARSPLRSSSGEIAAEDAG